MQSKIKKWGNSQGIIIPKELLKEAGIKINELIEVTAVKGSITISVPFRHKTLEERVAESGGEFLVSDELDMGEPMGRELL